MASGKQKGHWSSVCSEHNPAVKYGLFTPVLQKARQTPDRGVQGRIISAQSILPIAEGCERVLVLEFRAMFLYYTFYRDTERSII